MATLELRIASVDFRPPYRSKAQKSFKSKPISMNAILAREINPPANEKPLEWLLLTNLAADTYEDAYEKIEWYCMRWQIEVLHKVLKSGCKIEDCQLEKKMVN